MVLKLLPVKTGGMAECGASAERWRERPAVALLSVPELLKTGPR